MKYQCSDEGTFNDKWLIEVVFRHKLNGYYIEVGAARGVDDSTSYCLEKFYGWDGVSIEANPHAYEHFIKNRQNPCVCAALAGQNGQEEMVVPGPTNNEGFAALTRKVVSWHEKYCYEGDYQIISVPTIDFPTLLEQQACPRHIDFISMDIEGAECEALAAFPFHTHHVSCIILELNHPHETKTLMKQCGYKEVQNPFNTEAPWERYFLHHDFHIDESPTVKFV